MKDFLGLDKLDLHGTYHKDVKQKLDTFLHNAVINNLAEVEVVTGNSDKMKEIVKTILAEYNLSGSSPIYNTGTLIISLGVKL